MSWKRFLKPNKRKIILIAFWVIILIILKTLVFSYSCMFCGVVISAFILNLITSYLISCLVVWIHDKKVLRNWAWIIAVFIIIVFIISILYFLFYIEGALIGTSTPVTQVVYAVSFEIPSANYSNGRVIATIKNTGYVDIKIEDAFVGGVLSKIDSTIYAIKPNEMATISVLNASEACGSILAIRLEVGLEYSRVISC